MKTSAALVAVLFLAACGGVPVALPQKVPLASEDADAQAKRFAPAAAGANLYIARTSIVGSRYRFGVLLDGKPAGVVGLSTYLLLEVAPGEHRISATSPENEHVLVVDAKAGQNYFFELGSRMGTAYARAELRPLAEADGKAAVMETRRASAW